EGDAAGALGAVPAGAPHVDGAGGARPRGRAVRRPGGAHAAPRRADRAGDGRHAALVARHRMAQRRREAGDRDAGRRAGTPRRAAGVLLAAAEVSGPRPDADRSKKRRPLVAPPSNQALGTTNPAALYTAWMVSLPTRSAISLWTTNIAFFHSSFSSGVST